MQLKICRSRTCWFFGAPIVVAAMAFICYAIVIAPWLQTKSAQPANAIEAKAKNAQTAAEFEGLAQELKIFPAGEFGTGGGRKLRDVPDAWADPWYKIRAVLTRRDTDESSLISLLKHKDPKVRTLALAALFDREDPKLLPHIASLVDDDEKTAPRVRVLSVPTTNPILDEQTVGEVARGFVGSWLSPVGSNSFQAYWNERKDRKCCASWLLLRMLRAAHFSSDLEKDREPLIRAVRKDVDALPELDRDWTLIWLAAHRGFFSERPAEVLASAEERIAAGKRLGPGRLMDLIHGKRISDDPDLSVGVGLGGVPSGRGALIYWVLRNAPRLLRPEDSPALLLEEKKSPDEWISHGFAIAAADLQPANAKKWLREALHAQKARRHDGYESELAATLWRIVGESEIDYLADWYYGLKPNLHFSPGYGTIFLRQIKGIRAPADHRKLIARLVDDKRLKELDYHSLRGLIETVNEWTVEPVVSRENLWIWIDPRPPMSEHNMKIVAEWRDKLKRSRADWNK